MIIPVRGIVISLFSWGGLGFLSLSGGWFLLSVEDFRIISGIMPNFNLGINLFLSQKFFLCFALVIGFSIINFSHYYMKEVEVSLFGWFLSLFLGFILILALGSGLFTIFVGWEGVGVISFILIGWFSSREVAIFRRKKAIFYNRLGDFFFLLLLCWQAVSQGRVLNSGCFLEGGDFSLGRGAVLMMGCVCVLVKSAQFFFNPWLTSAMEGPTPVRALLHRRTMVVAGVYFFFLAFYFISQRRLALLFLCFIRSLTNLITSFSALTHKDVKKVIALSTARQLSFIIFTLSLGLKDMAFFHLLVHGFFKALLFLCRGILIHHNGGGQDIRLRRVVGGRTFPSLKIFFRLGRIALMGLPFIGGFFRKHKIITLIAGGGIGFLTGFLWFASLGLTTAYRVKLLMRVFSRGEGGTKMGRESSSLRLIPPMVILILLVSRFGWVLGWFFLPGGELTPNSGLGGLTPAFIIVGLVILGMAWKFERWFFFIFCFISHWNRGVFSTFLKKPSKNSDSFFEKALPILFLKRWSMRVAQLSTPVATSFRSRLINLGVLLGVSAAITSF
jgi:NADH:ubiquinone oxidoreductase subunit 5 (subunit L)/multisubunit Na+/H+ antiporter MnhA subunit